MFYCVFNTKSSTATPPCRRPWPISCLCHLCRQIMCRCSSALENSVKEKISMFCHVEPEQVRHWSPFVLSASIKRLTSPSCLFPGHLCARCVVHLQSAVTAGESGRGGLPEQETEHAHRDPTQENVDQMEGDVWQASPQTNIHLNFHIAVPVLLMIWGFYSRGLNYMLSSQVRQTVRAVLNSSGREVHQVFRLLCFCHQGTGALGPGH